MRQCLSGVVILVLLGCGGESTRPLAPFAGAYNLVAVNGAPPPAPLVNSASCAPRLVGENLFVFPDDSLTETITVIPCSAADGQAAGNLTFNTGTLVFHQQGAEILIDHPASDSVAAWVDTGTVAGDTVTIRSRFPSLLGADSVVVLRYVLRPGP